MPPASNPTRKHAPSFPAASSPSPLSSLAGEVASGKKKKNGSRRDNRPAKAEPKTILDELEASQPIDQLFEPTSTHLSPQIMSTTPESSGLDGLDLLSPPEDIETTARTDTWARSIPFGKSPPQDVSNRGSVEEPSPNFGLAALQPAEKAFQPSLIEASPQIRPVRRPSIAATEQSAISRNVSRDKNKRNSMTSQFNQNPPPPHLPQAHFYSAPDIEIPGVPSPIMPPVSEQGCSFYAVDVLPHPRFQFPGKRVIVVGRDGVLEVLSTNDAKARVIGSLKGLHGRVLDAKILTWASSVDPFSAVRPLIGVIVFGPVPKETTEHSSAVSENGSTVPASVQRQDVNQSRADVPYMQSCVQIYSLKTQALIATLFTTKPDPCYISFPGAAPSVPFPAGELKLYSTGNYMVLASGTSGEVFVFGVGKNEQPERYHCLGKYWTTVRGPEARRYSQSSCSTNTADELSSEFGRESRLLETSILSLSGRWLAIVPAPPTKTSLRGTIHCPINPRRKYDIDSHTPPSRPSTTCTVDYNRVGLLNKIAKGFTQELVRGAAWTGGQVTQTWNNYFYKDTQQTQPSATRRPPLEQPAGNLFPPTHAQDSQQPSRKEPELVMIIDLKRLDEGKGTKSAANATVAVFQPPNGCSFVSLSPTGLMLFTASKKGDVHQIWDLMQIRYCRTKPLILSKGISNAERASALVREVAKFDRMTPTSIIDVRWTGPVGERFAVVTKNGTIHLCDIPRAAFQWPPLRRVLPASGQQRLGESPTEEPSEFAAANLQRFSTAIKTIGDSTQPFIAALRGRAPSFGAAFAPNVGMLPARGGKVLASGLSKSMGAAAETMNSLRHLGENRLHLADFAKDGSVSRMIWFGNENNPKVGIIDGEYFKIYQVRRSSTGKKKPAQSVFGAKIGEVHLPSNIRNPAGPSQILLTMGSTEIEGSWPPSSRKRPISSRNANPPPLSHAEIETNTPYQPFHTDRRVNLMVYSDAESPTSGLWVFGEKIPTILTYGHKSENIPGEEAQEPGQMENLINLGNNGSNVEYAVITTRRKKQSPSGAEIDEDGFFEDDCDFLDFAADRV